MAKLLRLLMTTLCLMVMSTAFIPATAGADACTDAGGVKVSQSFDTNGVGGDECIGKDKNPIFDLIGRFIQYGSGILGLVIVLMIVISGLQYVLSGGSPEKTKSAKDRLEHTAIGFIAFILMYGVLQVILPPDIRLFG